MQSDDSSTRDSPGHVCTKEEDKADSNIEHTSDVSGTPANDDEAEGCTTVQPVKYGPRDPFQPCVACGWTLDEDSCANYKSSIKLFYAASTRGAWALGSTFILKERMASPPSHEMRNLRFLGEKTNIPIPRMIQDWTEGERYFTITSRVEGETLEQAWPNLSGEDRTRIAQQVASHLKEMRRLTSDRIEAVDGQRLYEPGLFSRRRDTGQPPLASDEELWDELSQSLAHVDDKKVQLLRDNMPKCTPYTFTHGDLTSCNIIVKDGNFSGFIDFERSGFLPVWFEYVLCRYGLGKEDKEWKELLSEHIDQHPQAMNFYLARLHLKWNADGENARKYLNDLVEGVPKCPMMQIW